LQKDSLIAERLINCREISAMKMARWMLLMRHLTVESSFQLLQAHEGLAMIGVKVLQGFAAKMQEYS
jgi:hypothetical protein